MIRLLYPTIAMLACFVFHGAAHATQGSAIELRLEPNAENAEAIASVTGVATDGCPPTLAEARLQGRDLVLRAMAADATCLASAQAFALRSAPLPLLEDPGGVYRMRLEVQADTESKPWLEAFALQPAAASSAAKTALPETGFWWGERGGEFDRAEPGFGVLIETQDGTVAVSISGYDAAGNPEWLMGAARFDGPALTIELGRMTGGRGPHDGFRSPDGMTAGGRVHIEWLGSARALFWFERPAADGFGIDLVPVSMVRFGFANETGAHWLGRWLLAAERSFDGSPTPRAIDFVDVEPVLDGFALNGSEGERLTCTRDASKPNSPPDLCTLRVDDSDVDFTDVALGRLRRADDAAPLSLIRLGR